MKKILFLILSFAACVAHADFQRGQVLTASQLNGLAVKADLAASNGASLIGYTAQSSGAVARTVFDKASDALSVKDFGAKGDGVTDDTAAIQAALNTGKPVFMPDGRYRITSGLNWVDGSFLYASESAFFVQNTSNMPAIGTAAELFYDGSTGANTYVVRMAKVAVGTKPAYMADESQTLRHAGISGIFINCNSKADIGLYSARAGLGDVYNNVVATGCNAHGIWMGELWNAKVGALYAIYNNGAGISIGIDSFSWSGGNTVNGVEFGPLIAYENGQSLASWTTSDYLTGYGVGYAPGRSCVANYIDAEWNKGVGVVWAPTSGPQQITALYEENNAQSADTSNRWGVWYQGTANSTGAYLANSYHLWTGASGNTNAPRIKLTGTAPTGSNAGLMGPRFGAVTGGVVIDSDYGDYRIERMAMSATTRFVSHYPEYNDAASITSSQTTLYVGLTATGNGSGIDSSDLIAGLPAALRVARVLSSVSTIDYSAVTTAPSAALTLDGSGITQRITVTGGGTGRLTAVSGTAATWKNFLSELTLANFVSIERSYYQDGRYVLNNDPTMRMDTGSTAGAAVNVDNANVQISGTSVISVSGSSAATKIGISVAGDSNVTFSNAASGTIAGYSAANAINFDDGGGIITISTTTATATWAASAAVTRNSGGGGGMIVATNGLNP